MALKLIKNTIWFKQAIAQINIIKSSASFLKLLKIQCKQIEVFFLLYFHVQISPKEVKDLKRVFGLHLYIYL